MVLTPADVHNVAFSKPRIGKRGYNEQEVDVFIDLVEQELVRLIEQDNDLRSRNDQLRNSIAELAQRQAELAEREGELTQQQIDIRHHEHRVRQQEAELV